MRHSTSGRARLLLGALGLALAAGVVPAARAAAAPAPPPPSPAAPAPSGPSAALPLRFGVVDGDLLQETPAQIQSSLQTVAALGAGYVREQLSWNAVEPAPGVYHWAPFDRVVVGVAQAHLHLLVLVDFTPPWARPAGCDTWTCPPADPARFAAFVAAASARYRGWGVHDWEIWNEPNSSYFWYPSADPAAYSRLLSVTAARLRAVDRHAVVVSGGLAPEPDAGGNIDMLAYLRSMCTDGAIGVADAVGIHPYSFPVPPSYLAPWNAWSQLASTAVSVRGLMDSCGAQAKQVWATEFGAPTNGPGATATEAALDLAAAPTHVDEALQAEMASQAVAYAGAQSWFGALFWYSFQDAGTSTATNQNFFGLLRFDGSQKPAYGALRSAIASVVGRPA